MNLRRIALESGQVQYNTGKPCRRGHEANRYTSNGMCVECINYHKRGVESAIAYRRQLNNMRDAKRMVEAKVWVQLQYQQLLSNITDIMSGDNPTRADALAQFILMIGTTTLDTAKLRTILQTNDDYKTISNYAAFPMTNDDATGLLRMQIDGEWYLGQEVLDCVRGITPTVSRVVTMGE